MSLTGTANRRVIVFDADTGAYKRHWGAYGKKPEDTPLPPRAQIIQGPPPALFNNPVHSVVVSNDDLVYVADRGNNRLQVFALDGTFVREVFIKRDTLQNEGTVHDFAFSPDKEQRFLYVVDGSNKWVRILNRKHARDCRFSGRPRRARRAGILPHPQHGGRFEGQHLPRRGEPGTAVHEVRVQRDGSAGGAP